MLDLVYPFEFIKCKFQWQSGVECLNFALIPNLVAIKN